VSSATPAPADHDIVASSACSATTTWRLNADDYHATTADAPRDGDHALHPECNYLVSSRSTCWLLAAGEPVLKPVYDTRRHAGAPVYLRPARFCARGAVSFTPDAARRTSAVFSPDGGVAPRMEGDARLHAPTLYTTDEVLRESTARVDANAYIAPQRAHADSS